MKKVRLDLERLTVESFATERNGGAERGTVRGHDSEVASCWDDDCSFGCYSHTGLDFGCICPLQGNSGNGIHSCGC